MNDPYNTEYYLSRKDRKFGKCTFSIHHTAFPGAPFTRSMSYLYFDTFPFSMTLVVTHPDTDGLFPEDYDYINALSFDPESLRIGTEITDNMLILNHSDLVARIPKEKYIRGYLIDDAIKHFNSLINYMDQHWIDNRDRLYEKPTENDIKSLNYILSFIPSVQIKLTGQFKRDKEQLLLLQDAILAERKRWKEL